MDHFPKINTESLLKDVEEFYSMMEIYVKEVSRIEDASKDFYLEIVYRSILRKQYDSLASIIELVRLNRGYSASILLRPCCEELIWVKYLKSIDKEYAKQIIHALEPIEIYKAIKTQDKYMSTHQGFTSDAMQQIGFSRAFIAQRQQASESSMVALKEVGKRLKWGRTNKDTGLPSVYFIAEKTKSNDIYDYLYHATSRSVHFSVHELYRRVWGNAKLMTIDSKHFEKYWATFSLYWGWKIFLDTFFEIPDFDKSEPPEIDLQIIETIKRLDKFPPPPIITAAELNYPI